MSLPVPNLDDRTFDDIMREALARIQERCPSWTDFNRSDPGVTIVELLAWMTETILYRLNRVPEKNYVKFLELLGLTLRPAQPSRTWVVFNVAEGADEKEMPVVPARARLSTSRSTDEPVCFETLSELSLTSARIRILVARQGEEVTDLSSTAVRRASPAGSPAEIPDAAPHVLFLASDQLDEAGNEHLFRIHVEPTDEEHTGVSMEWECWNGQEWEIVLPVSDTSQGFAQQGRVEFADLPPTRSFAVDGTTAHWIRARLLSTSGVQIPRIVSLRQSLQLRPGYSLLPSAGYVADSTPQFFPIDFSLAFRPFAGWPHPRDSEYVPPTPGNALYVGSPLFGRPGNTVSLNITMSGRYTPASTNTVAQIVIRWEYYSASGTWKTIGTSRHTGVEVGHFGFSDSTDAFTESGVVSFTVQDDAEVSEVHRDESFWVRARMEGGGYGSRQENAPVVERLLLSFEDAPREFDRAVSYNYFDSRDITADLHGNIPVAPFVVTPQREPMLYLCLDQKPSTALHTVYVQFAVEQAEPQRIAWEYRGPDGAWASIDLRSDSTAGFSQTGVISFIPPEDWTESSVYEVEGFWLRARWIAAVGRYTPPIAAIRLNGVEVEGALTVYDEVLGSTGATPGERLAFNNAPVLPDPLIYVREIDTPSAEQVRSYRERHGDDVRVETGGGPAALWVRWHPVESLGDSGPDDRHFTVDAPTGTISFGDGVNGKLPPAGPRNVRADSYRICLGAAANVGRFTITTLDLPVPYIEDVGNLIAATGGADPETVEEAKQRGSWVLKHRHRAVTTEDFERLAREASGEVAMATCSVQNGEILVTVIPKSSSPKPTPGVMLVRRVRDHLDARRLVTTRLRVAGPRYESITIGARIAAAARVADIPGLRNRIEEELRGFVHPLTGGPNRAGWPIGRPIHLSEIYYLLERTDGVDYVDEVRLNESTWTQRVDVGPDAYPFFSEVSIEITNG